MKYIFLLLFAVSTTCVAQKNYKFDYLLEYQFKSYKDSSSNRNLYYFTNSNDNSYFAKIENIDSLILEVELIEQDQLWAKIRVNRNDFFASENLELQCNKDLSYKNRFKFRTKEYEFSSPGDTLLADNKLNSYKLQYVGKRKRKKRFPVGTNLYIIEDSTEFHLPLLTHSTAFEEWKEERNIPNGIFKEKIFYDFKNKVEYKYILKDYHQISRRIVVPEECTN